MSYAISTVTVAGAGTAVQFSADTAPWQSIVVRARPNNGSLVYVGQSTVNSTAGIALRAGDAFTFTGKTGIPLSGLYVDADVANDRVDYFAHSD